MKRDELPPESHADRVGCRVYSTEVRDDRSTLPDDIPRRLIGQTTILIADTEVLLVDMLRSEAVEYRISSTADAAVVFPTIHITDT